MFYFYAKTRFGMYKNIRALRCVLHGELNYFR